MYKRAACLAASVTQQPRLRGGEAPLHGAGAGRCDTSARACAGPVTPCFPSSRPCLISWLPAWLPLCCAPLQADALGRALPREYVPPGLVAAEALREAAEARRGAAAGPSAAAPVSADCAGGAPAAAGEAGALDCLAACCLHDDLHLFRCVPAKGCHLPLLAGCATGVAVGPHVALRCAAAQEGAPLLACQAAKLRFCLYCGLGHLQALLPDACQRSQAGWRPSGRAARGPAKGKARWAGGSSSPPQCLPAVLTQHPAAHPPPLCCSPAGPTRSLLSWARLPLPLLLEGSQFCYPLRQCRLPAPALQLAVSLAAVDGWDSTLWHSNLPILAARSGAWRRRTRHSSYRAASPSAGTAGTVLGVLLPWGARAGPMSEVSAPGARPSQPHLRRAPIRQRACLPASCLPVPPAPCSLQPHACPIG